MESKIKNFTPVFICIILVCLCLIYSKDITLGVSKGIDICLNSLIPSMYIFMILGSFINYSKIDKQIGMIFNFLSVRLFKVSGEIFSIFFISAIGGYPVGVKIISDKIRQNEISSIDGQYLLNFCVYCSPAFLISAVSIPLWNDIRIGFVIYISQIISGLLIALICGFNKKSIIYAKENNIKTTFANNLIDAVNSATKSILVMSSFVVLFYAFFSLLEKLSISQFHLNIIKGVLEVTCGCKSIQNMPFLSSVILVSIFTSFGGICVIMQLSALLYKCKINIINFVIIRVIFSIISTCITYIFISQMDIDIACFTSNKTYSFHMYTVSPISSLFLIILGIMLLLFYNKSVKIK